MQRGPYAIALGLSLIAPELRAEATATNGVRLSFVRADNARECIAAPALEREIVRRMRRDPFAGSARQWVEGIVERQGDYYEVQLFERDAEGKTLGTRRLREIAGDCHKLDDAVVLAIALIIDPTAQLAPAIAAASPRTPWSNAAEAESRGAISSDAPRSALPGRATGPIPPDSAAAPPAMRHDAPTPRGNSSRSAAAFVSADAVMIYGVLPGLAPGAELVTRLPLEAEGRYTLRLSALYLPEKRQNNELGDLGYGLTALEAGACAGRSGKQLAWYGCTALGVGAVHAVVHSPEPFDPGDRLWMAFRVEAGLALHIDGPVWIETRLFDLVAARRWEFRVKIDEKRETAFTQSLLMPGAALGLGLHFD